MRRKVIIHKHLFKNAGTTFDWSLHKNFGNDFCDHRDDVIKKNSYDLELYNYTRKQFFY